MNLLRAVLPVSLWTAASRVLGFARDVVIASVFGAGAPADAFFAAFKLPNLLRRLSGEGALTQAFVPVFNRARETHGAPAARALADEIAGALFLFLAALTAVGVLGASFVVGAVAGGFAQTEGKIDLAAALTRITFPYIFFISLVAFGGGILNSLSRFVIPAATPLLLNLSLIGFSLFAAPFFDRPVFALAWGVFCGGVLQLALVVVALRRVGFLPRLSFGFLRRGLSPSAARVLKLSLQGALGVGVAQINLLINLRIASSLAEGSVSWLYYADRLMELPAGVLGAALAAVILPTLSRRARGAAGDFSRTLDSALRLSVWMAAPASVGLFMLSLPIVATLFARGAFGAADVAASAAAAAAYSAGVTGFVTVRALAAGFYAHLNVLAPVKIALVSLAATQLMNAVFILGFDLAHVGLALATALGALLNAGVLLFALRRGGLFAPGAGWGRTLAATAAATAAMALFLGLAAPAESFWLAAAETERVALLSFLTLGGAGVYALAARVFGARADFAALRREIL